MIVWRSEDCPPCLQGAANLTHWSNLWWLASLDLCYRPDPEAIDWVPVGEGVQAGHDPDAIFDPLTHLRTDPQRWAVTPPPIVDGWGRTWLIPMIYYPDGVPAVNRARRMDADGQWVWDTIDQRQRDALEAAAELRPHLDDPSRMDMARQSELVCMLLETFYHLDGASIAKLGILDDTLCRHVPRCANGLFEQVEEHLEAQCPSP